MRPIDADYLKTKQVDMSNDPYYVHYGVFVEDIDDAPTIEINTNNIEYKAYCRGLEDEEKMAARPTGEWENITPSNYLTPGGSPILRCPSCKDRESVHLGGVEGHHWVFCPICGSKMKGKGENA